MSDLSFEVFLGRIEVIRGKSTREDDNVWRITIDRFKPEVTIVTGLFRTANKDGIGRILAHGVIVSREDGNDMPSVEDLKESVIFRNCVEAIYDTARRSLNAQAATMDFSFDLPIRSPKAEIRMKNRTEPGVASPKLTSQK